MDFAEEREGDGVPGEGGRGRCERSGGEVGAERRAEGAVEGDRGEGERSNVSE